MADKALIPVERIERTILRLRGHNVMLDADLAALYQVDVKVLNQAVKRNRERFPLDFMFQLTTEEAASLRSQIVTLESGRGRHRKYLPYAFTEADRVPAAEVVIMKPPSARCSAGMVRGGISAANLPVRRSRSEGGKELGYGG